MCGLPLTIHIHRHLSAGGGEVTVDCPKLTEALWPSPFQPRRALGGGGGRDGGMGGKALGLAGDGGAGGVLALPQQTGGGGTEAEAEAAVAALVPAATEEATVAAVAAAAASVVDIDASGAAKLARASPERLVQVVLPPPLTISRCCQHLSSPLSLTPLTSRLSPLTSPERLVQGMGQTPHSMETQIIGATALADALERAPSLAVAAANARAVDVLVRALRSFGQHGAVQAPCWRCLHALARAQGYVKRLLLDLGGLQARRRRCCDEALIAACPRPRRLATRQISNQADLQ